MIHQAKYVPIFLHCLKGGIAWTDCSHETSSIRWRQYNFWLWSNINLPFFQTSHDSFRGFPFEKGKELYSIVWAYSFSTLILTVKLLGGANCSKVISHRQAFQKFPLRSKTTSLKDKLLAKRVEDTSKKFYWALDYYIQQ